MIAASTGPSWVSSRCPDVDAGSTRGARRRSRSVIQGMNTNWMNTNGSITSRNVDPASNTTTEKMRPASDSNVMSPNPNVVIVVRVQYTLVGHEYSRSSYSISVWKIVLNTATITTNTTASTMNVFCRRRRSACSAARCARS